MSTFEQLQRKSRASSGSATFTSRRPPSSSQVPTIASVSERRQAVSEAQPPFSLADIPIFPSERARIQKLPGYLKDNIEDLSGLPMDDVSVHYNSPQPAQVQALAYTRGRDIHVGPGQEQYLAHEAWHAVQQKLGRVGVSRQEQGVAINDDEGLEREADRAAGVMTSELSAYQQPSAGSSLMSRPGQRAAGHTPVLQRKIKYGPSKFLPGVEKKKQLIEELVKRYGEDYRETIKDEVKQIEESKEDWTLYDVHLYFQRKKLPRYREVQFKGSAKSQPTLPTGSGEEKRQAAVNQFSFNTVTRLVATIGSKQYEYRNDTKDQLHAEEQLMEAVSAKDLKANPKIVITINNSPCVDKCAEKLAGWVMENELTHVTLFFANPYGTDIDFERAIKILQGARIRVHGFDPLKYVEEGVEIESGYQERFQKMLDRLKTARGNNLYKSDSDSSASEESDEDKAKKKRRSVEVKGKKEEYSRKDTKRKNVKGKKEESDEESELKKKGSEGKQKRKRKIADTTIETPDKKRKKTAVRAEELILTERLSDSKEGDLREYIKDNGGCAIVITSLPRRSTLKWSGGPGADEVRAFASTLGDASSEKRGEDFELEGSPVY